MTSRRSVYWLRKFRKEIIAIAGAVAVVAVFATHLKEIGEAYSYFFGKSNPHLAIRNARAVVVNLAGDFVDNPQHIGHSRLSFIAQKELGVAVHNCTVKSDNESYDDKLFESKEVILAKDISETEVSILVRLVSSRPIKNFTFYLSCDGSVSNILAVNFPWPNPWPW